MVVQSSGLDGEWSIASHPRPQCNPVSRNLSRLEEGGYEEEGEREEGGEGKEGKRKGKETTRSSRGGDGTMFEVAKGWLSRSRVSSTEKL